MDTKVYSICVRTQMGVREGSLLLTGEEAPEAVVRLVGNENRMVFSRRDGNSLLFTGRLRSARADEDCSLSITPGSDDTLSGVLRTRQGEMPVSGALKNSGNMNDGREPADE